MTDRFEECRFYAELIYTDNLGFRSEVSSHKMQSWKRRYRQKLKEAQGADPLALSFREGRKIYSREDEYGEYFTEFVFLRGTWTDEDLDELAKEEWISICSSYDCTGQVFTSGMDFVRTPDGVIWKHRKGLDV